jgi:hypothetical protein
VRSSTANPSLFKYRRLLQLCVTRRVRCHHFRRLAVLRCRNRKARQRVRSYERLKETRCAMLAQRCSKFSLIICLNYGKYEDGHSFPNFCPALFRYFKSLRHFGHSGHPIMASSIVVEKLIPSGVRWALNRQRRQNKGLNTVVSFCTPMLSVSCAFLEAVKTKW